MSEPGLECYNCGRENPPWAQVCRECGVSLLGAARYPSGPPPRFPSDTGSLVSMGSAIATIVLAILVGLFLANLDPSRGTALVEPSISPPLTPSIVPSVPPSVPPTATPAPATPSPTPALPGMLVFGHTLDEATREVVDPDNSYVPGDTFAYSIRLEETWDVPEMLVEVVKVAEDGTEIVVQAPSVQPVDPESPVASFAVPADNLIYGADGVADSGDDFGTGEFVMRIYRGEELMAEGPFTLSLG